MKKILLIWVTLLIAFAGIAQTSGGPDPYGYTFKNSDHTTTPPVYKWIDITSSGTQVTGLLDDNIVGPFNISSGFQFYWYTTPQIWIGSNGYLSFVGDNIGSPFPAVIPSGAGAHNFIAPMMSDLTFTGTSNPGRCYYYSTVDSLVVSYINVPFWANATPPYTGGNTFQVILDKNDNSITINYRKMDQGTVTSLDNIIGIENVSGALGLQVAADSLPRDSSTVKFYFPASSTYQVVDGGINWNGNPSSGGVFTISQGSPVALDANIRNFGNQRLGSFTVQDSVLNGSQVSQSTGQLTIPVLVAGRDTSVTFPNTFSAPSAGTYTFVTEVKGISGDLVAGNNILVQEVVAIDTTQTTMNLDYSDGLADGTGLGWNGGDGGIGIYVEPPFYPAKVSGSRFYISSGPNVGFNAKIYDDDGPGGTRGTLLDSVAVTSNISANAYKNVNASADSIILDSGGVYLVWEMRGANINLGRDLTPPFSRRTYELVAGGWAEYRDRLTEDFLMGLIVEYPFPKAKFDAAIDTAGWVSFTDKSSNTPTAWIWDFGDSTAIDTSQNPVHHYIENGLYNVCLKASNKYGSDSTCKTLEITNVIPLADFDANLDFIPAVFFTDKSLGAPTVWAWDFDHAGDDTSTVQDPRHNFPGNGVYNVCLISTNSAGPSKPYCEEVSIQGLGIGEANADEHLVIMPNPMTDRSVILLATERPVDRLLFRCFDISGKEVNLEHRVEGKSVILDRNGEPSGNYFFELSDGQTVIATGRLLME